MTRSIILALSYLLWQVVGFLVVGAINSLAPGLFSGTYEVLAWALILSHTLVALHLYCRDYLQGLKSDLRPCKGNLMFLSLAFGVSVLLLMEYVVTLLDFLPDINDEAFDGLYGSLAGIIGVALTGPIAEELLFRKAITTHLKRSYSKLWKVVLVSGLVFGVMHLNPAQVVSASLSGFMLAYLFVVTGSILPCVLLHIFNNTLAVVLDLSTGQEEVTLMQLLGPALFWVLLIVLSASLVLSFLGLRRALRKSSTQSLLGFESQGVCPDLLDHGEESVATGGGEMLPETDTVDKVEV